MCNQLERCPNCGDFIYHEFVTPPTTEIRCFGCNYATDRCRCDPVPWGDAAIWSATPKIEA